jgi:hypothetical protein
MLVSPFSIEPHLAALFAVAGLFVAAPAAAGPARRVDLAWSQEDPTCLGASDLASVVERTLGRPVFHAEAPPSARVTGSVARGAAGRFEAHLALVAADGRVLAERALSTPGGAGAPPHRARARPPGPARAAGAPPTPGACGRLDESIALVVTLMIDSVEEAPTPLSIPASPPRPSAPPAAPPRPLVVTLGLGAGFSWSLVPRAAPSLALRGEIAPRGFVPIALAVRVHPFDSILVGGVGGNFNAWTAELSLCPAWSNDRVRAGGCAGFAGGTIDGSEVNLLDGESHVRPLVLVTVTPFVSVRLGGSLWARLEAGVWFPLLREPWGYLNVRNEFIEIFRPGIVVPAAALTFELQSGS